MNEEIVNADTDDGQALGETVIEVVENQLAENNPPEVQGSLVLIQKASTDNYALIRTRLYKAMLAMRKTR